MAKLKVLWRVLLGKPTMYRMHMILSGPFRVVSPEPGFFENHIELTPGGTFQALLPPKRSAFEPGRD